MLIVTVASDIVIVESPSDLNVYTSTNDDGTAKEATENTCCSGETTSEDSFYSDTCRRSERSTTKPCCSSGDSPEKTKDVSKTGEADCCSAVTEKNECADVPEVRDLDLNIWAGSFKIYALKP